ncbi:3-hydroxyisobutyrate dehydrogenase mitochondrial precursor [Aaosphaeria arxii CBS 175.79]|uniref:3-hydroxyisobutyrate dehydrogenase mitochondrial n=1 Tax=Aaosphaeria arxii CBS 175.79 TaxID=1450172 RepID=A0A6A5YAG8_9PLEO|nr:3-hydroxyisobutyrate dehydrogenase mitochondrial precursor [Aaosphaeria arxii CBS 175.79]KAF2022017.1 3-hydroxyisobutyrate dehydrogenase mitochondrial precursor [Aaosphaeria arxii CBS 175.79]
MSSKPAIGFAGLGAMGFGMATNLVKQGYAVTGFDVYAPTLEKFKAAGGVPSTSLAESARDKPFYIVMVATAQQAQAALFESPDGGIVSALPKDATLLLCSTVPSAYAQGVEKQLKDVGRDDIFFIDAPVSGGAIRAAQGTLSIMAGASSAAFQKGQWLLEEMSAPKKLFIVEGGIGAGSNMKMAHQVLAAIQILALSEGFGFGARLGLNGKDIREAVIGSEAWSWMFENRSTRTLTEDYFPGASAVTIILKDTSIITSTARLVNFPASLSTIAEQVYFSAVDRGWGANDDAGLVRLWTSEPVANIQSTLSDEDKKAKIDLVISLLTGIHLVAAAESIAFAKHVGLPLAQLYKLAVDAAGGSAMFKSLGPNIIEILEGKGGETSSLNSYLNRLKEAVGAAQSIRSPVYLGSGALNLLVAAGKELTLAELLKLYTVN